MKNEEIIEKKQLGCNKNLGRGLCGEISFANKIILCDDCVFNLIEERDELQKALSLKEKEIEELKRQVGATLFNLEVAENKNKLYQNKLQEIGEEIEKEIFNQKFISREYREIISDRVIKKISKIINNSQELKK